MFGYVYKTTNLINNKIYIGKHKSQCFDNSYYGSGISLKKAIDKYGIKNFKCEILHIGNSNEELNILEKYYIKLYNSQNLTIGYNISDGGDGAILYKEQNGMFNKHLSEESRNKISNSLKGKHHSEETKEKIKKSNIGKKHNCYFSNEVREKISKANKGKILSEETKQKISQKLKELNIDRTGKNNSFYGKHHSEETKEKIRQKNKGKKYNISPEGRLKMSLARKGKKVTDKLHDAIIKSNKERWKNPEFRKKILEKRKLTLLNGGKK